MGRLPAPALEQPLEVLQRLVGLALGHPAHEQPRRDTPHHPSGGFELVLVLVAGAAVAVGVELVGDARVGAGRALALPRAQARGLELRQGPVHGERRAAQREPLLDVEALLQRPLVGGAQLAVDRDPVAEAPRIHDHGPDLLRAGRDVDGGADLAHRAASSSSRSQSRSARSTAASKECRRTPKAGAASWRGRRSYSSDSMSGVMRPTSSSAMAAATTDATPVIVTSMPTRGRRTSMASAIRSTSSP